MSFISKIERYGLAVCACGLAVTLARLWGAPSSSLLLAVMVSALFGGRGPGLFSIGLSAVAFDFFFVSPKLQFWSDRSSYTRFAAFIGAALLIDQLISAKRRSDEARRRSDEDYRVVAETAPDAILTINEGNQIVFANAAAATIFGGKVSDLIGSPLSRIMTALPSEEWSPLTEVVARRIDGTEFSAEASFAGVDRNGRRNFIGFVRDISERKQAQLTLRESESYLAEAQKLSHTGSFGVDSNTGEIIWSDETYRIAGYALGVKPTLELLLQRVHPEDRSRVQEMFDHAICSGSELDFEHRFLMPDGSVKHVHVVAHAIRNGAALVEYRGAVTDVTATRRAEEELRRSEEKYRELTQLSPDAIYVVDENGFLALTNPAGLAMLECSAEQAIGLDIAETHLLEDRDAYHERRQQLQAGRSFQFERSFLRRDGTILPVEVKVSPIRGGFSQAVIRDISERKRAQEALERSEFYLAEAEKLSRTGSWAYDVSGQRFIFWSQGTCRLEGHDPRQPLPTLEEMSVAFQPEDWTMIMEHWTSSIAEQRDFDFEACRRFPDGRTQNIRCVGHPLVNDAGEVHEVIGMTMDITEQVEARAALKNAFDEIRRSEDQLQLIINTIPALVWCAAPDGKLEYMNQRIMDYLGVPVLDIVEHGWINFLYPDDVEPPVRSWSSAVASGSRHEVEYRMRGSDGSYRWFHVLGQPLRDAQGRIIRWYGLLADIEDRKHATEILRETQARLSQAMQIATVGEFAASIAHEVNQPLAAVVTNAHACLQWLMARPPNLSEANLAATRIIRNGNQAAEVVRRIRALFKQAEPEMAPLDLNEVIAEVIRLLKAEFLRRGVAVEIDLTPTLPPIIADRLQLQQVIFNLLQNGMDAMDRLTERPKKIFVRSKRQGTDAVVIEIRDNGAGMNDLNKPFEAFYTTKEHGMGMGLAISRSIVAAHRGHLWAAPTEGPGATLCFSLPLEESAPTEVASLRGSNHFLRS
jgi:PAS domain S-box-containing protein